MIFPQIIDTNLVFYLMLFTLAMALMNLVKNTFNLGYFRITDETKVELLMAIKAFGVVFILLHYFGANYFFDLNIEQAHKDTVARINTVLELTGAKLDLPI